MDKKTMMQVLVPAAAAAAVVLLVGVLVALGDGSGTAASAKSAAVGSPPFPLDAPEWQPVDEAKYPGLKYWDVKEGTGTPCPAGGFVSMHYTGWLTNGKKFDSSKDRGKPLEMSLDGLIQGWQAGVPGMKPGGVRRLLIPAKLGYGDAGSGSIPPGSTLLFEMELLSAK